MYEWFAGWGLDDLFEVVLAIQIDWSGVAIGQWVDLELLVVLSGGVFRHHVKRCFVVDESHLAVSGPMGCILHAKIINYWSRCVTRRDVPIRVLGYAILVRIDLVKTVLECNQLI